MVPTDVDDVMLAFPAHVVGKYLPEYEDIPEEFKRGRTKWNDVMSQWFFKGLPGETEFIPKKDIDGSKALRHLKACLGSYEPSHEHKEAGVAYLMSLWFEDIIIPERT